MKIKSMLFGLVIAGAVLAQDATPPPTEAHKAESPRQQRIFQLKYADARDVSNVLEVFGYGIKPNRDLHVVAVSAPPEGMAAVEDAIRRLDVPAAAPKDLDLTICLLVASEQPVTGAVDLPADLQPVANELKRIFSYKGFRLLDSILLRTQPGERATASGMVGVPERSSMYDFTVTPTSVTEDPKGRLIRLDNLGLNLHGGDRMAGIHTEITVREGQRVVVGKSNMGPDQALILVVSAKVTE